MRIITGRYKGRHFDVPRTFKARPTTDFAKENIFNVLTGYIDFDGATALDLFSGTGSITLELLSRGCAQVVSVELDRDHHRFIQQCINKLKGEKNVSSDPFSAQCIRGDVFRYIKSCRQQFDFIFADPPYALKELPQIPDLILGSEPSSPTPQSEALTQHSSSSTQQSEILVPQSSSIPQHTSLLKPGGIFVFEHGKDYDFSQYPRFADHRQYGSVNFTLFR